MTYFICCTLTKAACVFIVKVIKERRNPTIVLVFQMLRLEKVRETEIFYNVKCGKILSELTSPKVTWPEMTSPKVTWPEMLSPEVTWPETTVTWPEMIACACPNFSRAFFLHVTETPRFFLTIVVVQNVSLRTLQGNPFGVMWPWGTSCSHVGHCRKKAREKFGHAHAIISGHVTVVSGHVTSGADTCYLIFLVHDVIKHFIFPSFFPRTFSNRIVWNTRTMVGFLRSLMPLTMNTHAAFVNVQQMKYVIGSGKYYIWNNMLKNRTNVLFINIIIPMHILIM
jgi:hypothetical protein